jgi:hypothetical protein
MKLFDKPFGKSSHGDAFWASRYNDCIESPGPVICDMCGTQHQESGDKNYIICVFTLGSMRWKIVRDCCGGVIDSVYECFAEKFFTEYINEIVQNPSDPRFPLLISVIEKALSKASLKANEALGLMRKLGNLLANGPRPE